MNDDLPYIIVAVHGNYLLAVDTLWKAKVSMLVEVLSPITIDSRRWILRNLRSIGRSLFFQGLPELF